MINLKEIKNIIFDFGGVIYDIDFSRSIRAFKTLGIDFGNIDVNNYLKKEVFIKMEKGLIKQNDFIDFIHKQSKKKCSDTQILQAWNALLIGTKKERIEKLQQLAKTYRLFLLSNTNEIHVNYFINQINSQYHIDFLSIFEKAYLSCEINMVKPDEEIYQYVIKENNLIPEQTLFIDDNYDNVEAAKLLKIKTYYFNMEKDNLCEAFNV